MVVCDIVNCFVNFPQGSTLIHNRQLAPVYLSVLVEASSGDGTGTIYPAGMLVVTVDVLINFMFHLKKQIIV